MASYAKITKARRRLRKAKAGRRRKTAQGKHSTPSNDELFADCGEPGQPAPPKN